MRRSSAGTKGQSQAERAETLGDLWAEVAVQPAADLDRLRQLGRGLIDGP